MSQSSPRSGPAAGAVQLQGFYVSFSGESSTPINNLYALSPSGKIVSTAVLDVSQSYQELRGMAFDSAGRLYVSQAYKGNSAILQFAASAGSGSYTRAFLASYATPSASSGLLHPYQPAFGPDGNLYVSSQDTNVVTGFFGPASSQAGKAMVNSSFLQRQYPSGTFNPGTLVPAWTADSKAPKFTPVPVKQGGLTFTTVGSSSHSVRGLAFDDAGHLFVADEGNDRVAVFDATSGSYLGAITASKNHSVQEPVAVWFDPAAGLLYISSPGNQRIFTYPVANVASGNFQASSLMQDSKRLDKVSGITVDPAGNLYTCSRKTNDIYQWSANGTLLGTFAKGFSDSPEQIVPVYSGFAG
jgi:hypothetical protein